MLRQAIKKGKLKVVKEFLGSPCVIDEQDCDGNTCLHLACYEGHKDIISVLIANGACLNYVNNFNQSPLMVAIMGKKCIPRGNASLKALAEILCQDGSVRMDLADRNGNTALHLAILQCSNMAIKTDSISLLLKYGASPTCRNNAGKTPYNLAVEKSVIKAINLLTVKMPLSKCNSNKVNTAKEFHENFNNIQMVKTSLPLIFSTNNPEKKYAFECPICRNGFCKGMPVLQCEEGHIFCQECKQKMESCPFCRKDIRKINIRNRIIEEVIAKADVQL